MFKYPLNEDFEFFLRLQSFTEIQYIPGMIVYHPVQKLPFLKSLFNAKTFAKRSIQSELLLMQLHPEGYAKVKYRSSAEETLKSFAFRYLITNMKPQIPQGLLHPIRLVMWFIVCVVRQACFIGLLCCKKERT